MNPPSRFNLRPMACFPPITIFEPFDFQRTIPPSDSPYTLVKTDDLRQMYNEISRVQTYLHNLIRDGEVIFEPAGKVEAGTKPSPARRIPLEILSLIFKQLVPPESEKEVTDVIIPNMAQFLLPGQVCKLWREAALLTPDLWSSLTFDLDPRCIERVVEMGATYLDRAKNHPLSIELRSTPDEPDSHPVIAMLLARAHQWCDLSLPTSPSVCKALLSARDRLPHLRRLRVGVTVDPRVFDAFQTAPQLRIAHLHFGAADMWHAPTLLPWDQLRHISFEGHALDCFRILWLSPSLLSFKATTKQNANLPSPLRHASLRELTVDARRGSGLFAQLTLPALVSLTYLGDNWPDFYFEPFVQRSGITLSLDKVFLSLDSGEYMPESRLEKAIRKLADITPNLSQLSLSDLSTFKPNGVTSESPWPTDDFISSFVGVSGESAGVSGESAGVTSEFTNIELACFPLTWATLEELKQTTATYNRYAKIHNPHRLGRILPKLKRLSLTGPSDMNYTLVANMVRSRWRDCDKSDGGPERLESVEVNAHTVMEPCTHQRSMMCITRSCQSPEGARALASLRLYRAEGLRLVIEEAECVECLEEEISRKRWSLEGK